VHAQILAVVFINASVRAGLSSQIDEGIAPAIGDRLEPFCSPTRSLRELA
jgi:hypothetical protein